MSALTQCPNCRHPFVPRQQPLTKHQARMLDFIRESIAANEYAPSFSEIAQQFGYRSLSTVHEHLKNLERKGYLTRAHNEERGITLVETSAVIS